ncbi:HpcH/HpaI aldolase family protein [Rouxiella badensis]|uniref:HpcH/HpaI aldolase family protein n=1 Tax=Rouxiella badensis TaxID=1646377 RepID=UPI00301E5553
MYENPLRKIWRQQRPVINTFLSIPSPVVSEIIAQQGFDALTIDLQHGLVDYKDALTMLMSLRSSAVGCIVRVPWLEPAPIMQALDAGADAIICPMVDNAEDAARLVSWVRYPPEGTRSFGPTRAGILHGVDYGHHANSQVLCLAMIETANGMKNLDEIAATPGLDGIYIGPADLTLALTGDRYRRGFDREEPEMIEALQRILEVAHRQGIRAGLHCGTAEYALRALQWGFDLVTIGNDVRMITHSAQQSLKTIKESLNLLPTALQGGY